MQACPHEAIAIRVVNREQVVEDAEAAVFLPAAPDPQITLPTTTYKTRRPFPRNLLPADYFRVNPQHAHWPLVVMLVLTQLSVGAFVAGLAVRAIDQRSRAEPLLRPLHAVNVAGVRPARAGGEHVPPGPAAYAFRAVLGLRHSWLSREIVAFGAFAGLASLYAGVVLADHARGDGNAADACAAVDRVARLERRRDGRRGRVLLGDDLRLHAARVLELHAASRVRFALTAALLGVAATWLSVLHGDGGQSVAAVDGRRSPATARCCAAR